MTFRIQARGAGRDCSSLSEQAGPSPQCPGPAPRGLSAEPGRWKQKTVPVPSVRGVEGGRALLVTGSVPWEPARRSRLACGGLRDSGLRPMTSGREGQGAGLGEGEEVLTQGLAKPQEASAAGQPISAVPTAHTLHGPAIGRGQPREGVAMLGEAAYPSSGDFHGRW